MKEVLKDIVASKEEGLEIKKKIDDFIKKIRIAGAKVILGGSGAKGTWLKDAHDADIFVCFSRAKFKDKSDKLSDILEKELKKKFGKVRRLHGSRDYFQIAQKDFTFEVVPIIEIKKAEDMLNITDVSPLHAKWVLKNSDENLRNEIRLVKKFTKANKVYGAESYIKGFSGYIVEVLTIHYRGFMKLIRAAAKWKEKEVIDTAKYYKNKDEVMFELNKSKTISPLVLVDPVDKTRNAAAALSEEKYMAFIDACKKYIKKQSKDAFVEKEVDIDKLRRKAEVVEAVNAAGKEDVVGCKLMKVFGHLLRRLDDNGFKVKSSGWEWNREKKSVFWFVTDGKKLSVNVIKSGPQVSMEKHAAKFRKKYKKVYEQKGRLFADVKRKYREASELLKDAVKDQYVKERVKEIKVKR